MRYWKNDSQKEIYLSIDMSCVICLDGEVHHALVPCGHMACCSDCLQSLQSLQSFQSRGQCPVCRQIITGTLRVFTVTEEERQRVSASYRSELRKEQVAVQQAKAEAQEAMERATTERLVAQRQLEMVNASRARKQALLHTDLHVTLKSGSKARNKALKKNAAICYLPDWIKTLITSVGEDGGYYTQCEESELQHQDQAVVIGYHYCNALIAQGEVLCKPTGRTVGGVNYTYWYTRGKPNRYLRYVID